MAKYIKLDCGLKAEIWSTRNKDYLEVSLLPLYDATADLATYAKLFAELVQLGYNNTGLSRIESHYGSTDDILLTCVKPKE